MEAERAPLDEMSEPRDAPTSAGSGESRDAALVRRCLDGEEAAWEALVRDYSGLVWSIGRRAGLSEEDVADVFQTVWRIAVEDLANLRRPERFGAWIGRTAHFQSLRVLRGYGITRRVLSQYADEPDEEPPPEVELARMEERLRVNRALLLIGERCQTILRLLYYEQPPAPYADIASRLGLRVGSVGPTRARCLERLQKRLERSGA